ncbi:MAG: hypothetical protein DI527_02015 [Chelatococcus sp.]|nr:MAG: hypothetical protein DI527_02015 [Chelatococcus sp.]
MNRETITRSKPPRFRFEIRARIGRDWPRLVSRHHSLFSAERRLLRLPLQPGETVTIYEEGRPVRSSAVPALGEGPEIPF